MKKTKTKPKILLNNIFVSLCWLAVVGGWIFLLMFILRAIRIWQEMNG
jgi:hypothetical protein